MKVLNPENTNHSFIFVPRFYGSETLSLFLLDETTGITEEITNTFFLDYGFISIYFSKTFVENEKREITIKDGDQVVYRGSLIATSQNPQQYKLTAGLYRYE
jgi:hypothetical protein